MSNVSLSLACWDYDRTRPLIDGRVKPDGIDLNVEVMRPREAFVRMLETGEFQVSEMSFSSYIIRKAEDRCPMVALPVMLSKMFRHDCIYVRADAGINTPEDLKGKRVGTIRFASTGLVYIKGLLQHDYGVKAADMQWYIGGLNVPNQDVLPTNAPSNIDITHLSDKETLEGKLEAGELDAIITLYLPDSFVARKPFIKRLFPDFKAAEIEYYKRTSIFPIMHVIVVREDAYQDNPWVAASLYKAFVEARDIAVHGLYDTDALHITLPFLIDYMEETYDLFGEDFFSYGLADNRKTVAALCQYLYEQELAPRLVEPEALFATGLE